MKKFLLILMLILIQTPAYAVLPLNGFEPQYGGARVTHKQYYGESIVEPYRWGNYFEKPVKNWYFETMKEQRKRIKADYKTYYNYNELKNYSYWK